MKRFLVTRTTVETFKIEAESLLRAQEIASCKIDRSAVTTMCVDEFLDKPKYRVVVEEDLNYQIGDAEDEDEVNAILARDGAFGYTVERRDTVGGKWEHVDSCWGFLGNDIGRMLNQAAASIPAGVTAEMASDYRQSMHGRTLTGTDSSESKGK